MARRRGAAAIVLDVDPRDPRTRGGVQDHDHDVSNRGGCPTVFSCIDLPNGGARCGTLRLQRRVGQHESPRRGGVTGTRRQLNGQVDESSAATHLRLPGRSLGPSPTTDRPAPIPTTGLERSEFGSLRDGGKAVDVLLHPGEHRGTTDDDLLVSSNPGGAHPSAMSGTVEYVIAWRYCCAGWRRSLPARALRAGACRADFVYGAVNGHPRPGFLDWIRFG